MILRGLVVAASGFLFIFSPGLPIGLLSQRAPALDRGLIYWGMGAWLAALLPSLFLQSLLRQIMQGSQSPRALSGQPVDYLLTLVGALMTAFFVQGVIYLVLRRKRLERAALLAGGLALGFGVGLISQIFTGLSLVGAGFRLTFGDSTGPVLAGLAQARVVDLTLSLLPLIVFRMALLVVSAAAGVLVARAFGDGLRFFWLAVAVDALFVWLILAAQIALGGKSPGQVLAGSLDPLTSVVTIAYCIIAFGLAYRWLAAKLGVRVASSA